MYFNLIKFIIKLIKLYGIQTMLLILSIYELRIDIRILLDSFTFSSLIYTFKENPLPIFVLLTIFSIPSRKYFR